VVDFVVFVKELKNLFLNNVIHVLLIQPHLEILIDKNYILIDENVEKKKIIVVVMIIVDDLLVDLKLMNLHQNVKMTFHEVNMNV
jgi:hypothetical protein